jgi:hypothetical protein
MGYYSSLIKRKFKDVVGHRYESVLKEYSEFLPTEEEMAVPDIRSILIPLDIFVKEIPRELIEVLSAYDADVSLVYITDAQVYAIIQETLDREAGDEFLRKKEEYGQRLLDRISADLTAAGIAVHSRMFSGHKGEDVEKIAGTFDMVAISKSYGAERTEGYPVSPLALRITQHLKVPTVIY